MTAIKKDELERLERKHGVGEDGLSYQHRCSRITALEKGEQWTPPESAQRERKQSAPQPVPKSVAAQQHPLWGKRLLITPMMVPDAKRNLYFDEPVGHEIKVQEVQAGELIYGAPEEVDRMVGDYKVVREDKNRVITAKTTLPKIGTEISWLLGKELVPVVRGNNGDRGYIWSFPTSVMQFDDTMVQVYGLKTLVTNVYPELLSKFSGKPMMSYVDGITLVASIPLTDALFKEQRRKELLDARAGLV